MNWFAWLGRAVILLSLVALPACGGDAGEPAEEEGDDGGWALVVGISEYENFPPLEDGVSRAERMRRVFQTTWGVPEDNTRTLFNDEATREAIRESLVEWLPSVVSEGDQVLVFLSGYGSQIEDISGDEDDGLDEGFCTADALSDSYERDILDDSLSYWLDQLPTERVTLIMEGQQFGQGDYDPDHPAGDEAASEFPAMEAIPVTRCGHRPMDGGGS